MTLLLTVNRNGSGFFVRIQPKAKHFKTMMVVEVGDAYNLSYLFFVQSGIRESLSLQHLQ